MGKESKVLSHFHTSEKCRTKDEKKESRDIVASAGHLPPMT